MTLHAGSMIKVGGRVALTAMLAAANLATVGADDDALFSFMPVESGGMVVHSSECTDNGSEWAPGLEEKKVFQHEIRWGDKETGWQLRVGKGGQIYSFVGPFGEAMPPQIHKGSEWNDEVWQLVSICTSKNDRTLVREGKVRKRPLAYFIHGSGVYKRDPKLEETFYNPVLAESSCDSSYAILNWGQHAHVPTIYKSGALYYTRFNTLKDGTIELNYAIHNFGDDVLNYFNTPWGGVRHSNLPVHILSTPDGSYAPTEFIPFAGKGIKSAHLTGGWSGFFTKNDPEAWGIALVFGNSRANHTAAKVRYRWGYAGNKLNPRDYFVSVVNPLVPVKKQETLRVKVYVVVDQLKNISKRVADLVPMASYQVSSFDDAPQVAVQVDSENRSGELKLYAWPKQGTQPLFLLKETKTGKYFASEDLYQFSSRESFSKYHPKYEGDAEVLRPYDGNTEFIKLLGFE
ncbi:hypothetical protein [Rubritalea marina]|uniref:hypothetical protein n=1 Tax=Rubritalea marina TaxID=361055 RepID=UPI00036BDA06|nr:hypothetical protein [Rubritalea marina]